MTLTRCLAVLLTTASILTAPALAQSPEPEIIIAQDAAAFFGGLCISTRGAQDAITKTIGAQQLRAVPLSDEGVQSLLGGKPGDIGWLVESGRGVGLKLLLEKPNICQIQTTDLSDDALQSIVASVIETLSEREDFTYEKAVDDKRPTNGGVQHLVGYQLRWNEGGLKARVAVSHLSGNPQADIPPQAQLVLTLEQAS